MPSEPHDVAEAVAELVAADAGNRLPLLVRHCVRFTGASAAVAAAADPEGRLRPGAATHQAAHQLMSLELARGAGPVVECFRRRRVVPAVPLTTQGPWPMLAAAADRAGFVAVEALPFRGSRRPVGVLGLYARTTTPLTPSDRRIAQAFADIAGISIDRTRTIVRHRVEAQRLQHALDSRVMIEQAKGILAERHGVTTGEAFHRLRRWSRDHNQRIHDVAAAVIANDCPPP